MGLHAAADRAGKVLSTLHIALHSRFVPLHADLFPIRARSAAQVRSPERNVAYAQKTLALSSLGRQRIRPRTLIRVGGLFRIRPCIPKSERIAGFVIPVISRNRPFVDKIPLFVYFDCTHGKPSLVLRQNQNHETTPADTALLPSSVGATECNRTGSVQNMDLAGVSGLRLPEQHPGTAKPQQPTFGHRGYQTGESRPLSVAGGIDHAKLHELPFVRSHGQQQLYGDLRHNGGNDDLRRWQAPYGSQEAESPESNGCSLGRGIRERHPHRHRTGLHAVPLRRRRRANQPQHGRSLEGPARPGRRDAAHGLDQPRGFRPAPKPIFERRIPDSRSRLDTGQL